jgi:hypothetical protein
VTQNSGLLGGGEAGEDWLCCAALRLSFLAAATESTFLTYQRPILYLWFQSENTELAPIPWSGDLPPGEVHEETR